MTPLYIAQATMPPEIGGRGGPGTNPEQLVALGYSACFESALHFVAGRKHMKLENPAVTCTVKMGRSPEGGFAFEFLIEAELPGVPRDEAEVLVAEAHQVCPYSNAFRNGSPANAALKG
jgi:Ohr subfamily peroxiredoxin